MTNRIAQFLNLPEPSASEPMTPLSKLEPLPDNCPCGCGSPIVQAFLGDGFDHGDEPIDLIDIRDHRQAMATEWDSGYSAGNDDLMLGRFWWFVTGGLGGLVIGGVIYRVLDLWTNG